MPNAVYLALAKMPPPANPDPCRSTFTGKESPTGTGRRYLGEHHPPNREGNSHADAVLTVGATVAVLLALTPAAVSATPAHADCGDPGQPACAGPIPSPDQVVAVLAELTDPGRPAASKSDVVTPGFNPEEAQTIDDHMQKLSASGVLPLTLCRDRHSARTGKLCRSLSRGRGQLPPNHSPGTCRDGQPGRALADDSRHRTDRGECVLGQRQPPLLQFPRATGGPITLPARGGAHPFRYRAD